MTGRQLSVLVDTGTFYEGPRWHDGRWWISDFYRHTVIAITSEGKQEAIMTVPNQPSGLGWHPDGALIVVSMKDRQLLRRDLNGSVDRLADLEAFGHGPLNDMVVDQRGRAWVGSFGFDFMGGADPVPANIVRVDTDGTTEIVADDMQFPNGSVITPDDWTLIVAESGGMRLTAFSITLDGTLTNRRIWAQPSPYPVAPDGCCLDAENHIWAADPLGKRCVRIAEGGEIVDEISMPEGFSAYACMLGGDDGRTFLICAAPGYEERDRLKANDAVLFTTLVDIPHSGQP
jgi:sugar lactone lactonase YvrE